MANVLQAESLENEVYTCAPGENNTPRYMLMDDDFEHLAFPDLFPYGTGGYNGCVRRTKLTMRQYFQQRLLNVDGRFARNMEYLFSAQHVTDVKHINSQASIALRLKRGRTVDGRKVTAGMLRNPEVINRLVKTEQAYKFLRQIRGSPAYWQRELYELLAMVRTLGIPTWFMTLSAADLHWLEMLETLAIHRGKRLSVRQIRRMSIKERAEQLKNDPVSSVTTFKYRVECFFRDFLLQDTHPVGKITEHAIKTEFQERGSPHAHCLLWVDGAPKLDIDSDEDVCAFIDEYVSGIIPDSTDISKKYIGKLVRQYETHRHSSYCRRRHACRFGFPKAPSPRTIICREPTDDVDKDIAVQTSTDILSRVYAAVNDVDGESRSLVDVLEEIGVSEDAYVEALKVSRKGNNVILKRDPRDVFTNGCNHDILRFWGANIDFQFVLNEYTCVVYITSYMMKAERAMGEVLTSVAKECRSDPIAEQLKKIGKTFVGKRVVGAPESAMRELSMWIMKKSRKVTYVNSNMKSDRVSLPKPPDALHDMEDDEDNVYMTSIHDRYALRPDKLENMCLAKFAVNYEYEGKRCRNDGSEGLIGDECDDDDPLVASGNVCPRWNDTIELKNKTGFMRKRTKEAILRVTSFKQTTDPEKYYHSRLLLYLPWRDEYELIDGYDSYKEKYLTVCDLVEHNAMGFNMHRQELENAIDDVADNGPPENVWDAIAPMAEAQNVASLDDDKVVVRTLDSEDEDVDGVHDIDVAGDGRACADTKPKNSLSAMYSREARKDILSNHEYRKCMRGLNDGQRAIVMYNRQWCKQRINAMRTGQKHDGFKIMLSGPGGTGKSHVIKLIRRDMIYLLQKSMKIGPDEPLVLLTAPTGLAAFNIGGVTAHSAFMLSTANSDARNDWEKKSVMQLKLANLALCVIDEISMVGVNTFNKIAASIRKIKQSSDDWGDVSILAVGDFYQLPPICQSPVYGHPKVIRKPGDMAPLLWDDFVLHELTDVMRTKDPAFANMLNSVRMAKPAVNSHEDLMLRSREMTMDHNDPDYPIDLMHVYATNASCDEWNALRLDALPGTLYSNKSYDVSKDKHTSLAKVVFPANPKMTGNLQAVLNMKVGARVMLTTNVNVSDGLTNGAMGTIEHIVMESNNRIQVVLVHFDSERVGADALVDSRYRHISTIAVPIYRAEATFKLTKVRVSRVQFPLTLCWAVTIHKCQGMTLPGVVVDMDRKKGRFRDGQAYVAFSRVTSLDTLHIKNYDLSQIRCSPRVENVMSEMRLKPLTIAPSLDWGALDRASHVTVVHLNICKLKAKLLDIQCDGSLKMADVICLNETHLDHNDNIDISMFGLADEYTIIRRDRNSHGGGLIMLVHNRLKPMCIVVDTDIECIIVQINLNSIPFYIMSVYRSPSFPTNTWVQQMNCILESYAEVRLCVFGDINENVQDICKCPIFKMFCDNGFNQHVDAPTCDTGSMIDHAYSHNFPLSSVDVTVLDCYYSDHDFVMCSIKI